MNKTLRMVLASALLTVTGSVFAAITTFETASNSAFTNYFSVTPTVTNKLFLQVSGVGAQYSSLSFDIVGGPVGVTAASSGGNLLASFSDRANTSYANQFSLNAGETYQLIVSGVTRLLAPNVNGVVQISSLSGTVSPVPEPESYALMLAGLVLVGGMVRRRNKKLGQAVR